VTAAAAAIILVRLRMRILLGFVACTQGNQAGLRLAEEDPYRGLRSSATARPDADITREKNLNPSRRDRIYPRVVKRARRNSCRVKKPGDHGTRHDGPATIKLVGLPQPGCPYARVDCRCPG